MRFMQCTIAILFQRLGYQSPVRVAYQCVHIAAFTPRFLSRMNQSRQWWTCTSTRTPLRSSPDIASELEEA
ncbi:hypothetical protein G7Z17_g9872 [Cylindrodendrum hubeiense]|uniref:Uncharacterized protein n=1 Tax=Cylindrodendrum hubeiense TaxID=595255 RepID=A0A9P5H0M3_9HYPO|nr:hypothetical protein G7Z17_g9872 [Cylindrodendrum hubeiense]